MTDPSVNQTNSLYLPNSETNIEHDDFHRITKNLSVIIYLWWPRRAIEKNLSESRNKF